jgi:hypothetical protein
MAGIGIGEENRGGHSFADSEGQARGGTTGGAITCISFWEDEGTGAGTTGAEGVPGAAQQALVQPR